MVAFYDALRVFEDIANDPAMQWRHVLRPGEALLFDNWRVLHGRAAYTGVRRMCGDLTQAGQLLGYRPAVDLRAGLRLTLDQDRRLRQA